MAANEILQFAPTDTGTNLLTQAQYQAATDRTNGNQPGIASAKLVNKQMRQSSLMAASVAQFLADWQATDVTDLLTPSQISAMIAAAFQGRLLNVQYFRIPGSSTYTSTLGTRLIEVEVYGSGGGSGGIAATNASQQSISGHGASGGYARRLILSGFSGATVTIGAGGAAGASGGGTGGTGGTTSFGAFITAPGGQGGQSILLATGTNGFAQGGQPQVPSGGEMNITGNSGYAGCTINNFGFILPPVPGMLMASTGYGGQGTSNSASSSAKPGVAGGAGLVVVREFA